MNAKPFFFTKPGKENKRQKRSKQNKQTNKKKEKKSQETKTKNNGVFKLKINLQRQHSSECHSRTILPTPIPTLVPNSGMLSACTSFASIAATFATIVILANATAAYFLFHSSRNPRTSFWCSFWCSFGFPRRRRP